MKKSTGGVREESGDGGSCSTPGSPVAAAGSPLKRR